ncbi:MAG: hypothetical protein WDN75_08750 [Bacteroidota bacterium]
MKQFSYRTWVLLLGIAVAVVIAVTLIFNGGSLTVSPEVTQKPAPATAPSVLLKKMIDPFVSRVKI